MITDERKYQAILDKDSAFEGIFVTAVKTTGIFCKPTCTARKPKRENVEFFSTPHIALRHGYRPCKICRPMELTGEMPQEIQRVLLEIERNPFCKISDKDLCKRGIEPHTIRRWFKKYHNTTFHTYQRMMRLGQAFTNIRSGESVAASAFEAGFESVSGFSERFRVIFEQSPKNALQTNIIYCERIATPLGQMLACASAKGICLVEFLDRKMLETELQEISRLLNATFLVGKNDHLKQLTKELHEYFAGGRHVFTVALDTPGTAFQQTVWESLRAIHYGETLSYSQQAHVLQKPNAVRSVAQANGRNRVAIIIPCHRVIGENGELKGYGGGLHRKQWLLDFEQQSHNNLHKELQR